MPALVEDGLHLGDVGREVALGGRSVSARAGLGGRGGASILSKRAVTSAGSTAPVDAWRRPKLSRTAFSGTTTTREAGDGNGANFCLRTNVTVVVVDSRRRVATLSWMLGAAVRDVRAVLATGRARSVKTTSEALTSVPSWNLTPGLQLDRPGQAVRARLRVVRRRGPGTLSSLLLIVYRPLYSRLTIQLVGRSVYAYEK